MDKIILTDLCKSINEMDVVGNKEVFIIKHKDINDKINTIDSFLNDDNEINEINENNGNNEKTFVEIIEELINLNVSELNNNISIEKLKYYHNLLKKYEELLLNEKNDTNRVEYV